jgi:hypothetical protein
MKLNLGLRLGLQLHNTRLTPWHRVESVLHPRVYGPCMDQLYVSTGRLQAIIRRFSRLS